MNSRPPTIAAVRDAVKATMARAPARGFAQRQVIEALEGYPEAARFLPAELGQPPAPKSQAFEAAAIAREGQDLREHFEERAGIIEHAGLPCPDAELEAARITATYAWNCQYTWASLRAALAAYPELLAKLPETEGPVDALPLGTAKVAVLKGRRVVRQRTFTGAQEVKA